MGIAKDVNMIISKDKITINTLELDFQTSIIENICDFISKEQNRFNFCRKHRG